MNYSQLNQRFYQIARDAIVDLSDLEVIKYSLGNLGVVFFPEAEQAIFHGHFSEAFWDNQAYQQYWDIHYGRKYRLNLAARMTAQLNDISSAVESGYSDEFARLMENDVWVRTNANLIRKDLLNDLPTEIEIMIDEMREQDAREINDMCHS